VKWLALAVGLLVAGLAIVGILLFGPGLEPVLRDATFRPPAEACPRLGFSDRRCQGVIDQAFEVSGIPRGDVISLEMGLPNGPEVGIGGYLSAVVRLHRTDGQVVDVPVRCIGIGVGPRPWCISDGPVFPESAP
jgi:hypothetical protein